ncbi:MAG: NAD-dependent epimerase/dehydratase family protein [Patescibacteria group bacterium]
MALYLVTGGAGFIGGHLCEALLKEGHRVRVLDNFSTGKRENVPENVEIFEADICQGDAIRPAFLGVDGVFHMAALPRVPYSIEHPVETSQVNMMGTVHVLTAARDAGVKRVVYSASSSAYGNPLSLPAKPSAPLAPLSPYALQKAVGELWMKQFSALYGLETVSLRYFNVYGPRMATEGAYVTVISIFLRQRKAGEPLTICGDGSIMRDFTHVSDIVRANMLAMSSARVGHGEVLNVGAGETHAIKEIAEIIGGPVVHIEPRKGDPIASLADTSLTKECLGWEPRVKLRDGLRDLIQRHGL